MKKIAFITIHIGTNFGSVLQTIATSEFIKRVGGEPTCVNYVPPRVTNKRFWSFDSASLLKKIFLFFWNLYVLPLRILNKKKYSGYLKKYCSLSLPVYADDNFVELCPKADVYMTGSDQVWNIKHNEGLDTHYFFDGIKGKKVSFASSIGYTDIGDDNMTMYKRLLSEYSALSVREDTAVELLRKLGYEAIQLLDPVFMLNKEEWKSFTRKKRIIKKPYLLVYIPYNIVDKEIIYRHALRISEKEGLRIVTFSWTYYKDKDADQTVRFASPGDFLQLVMDADYVITNSFHGTAFSINLNKKFWVFLPSGFTTRIMSVLKKFELEDRLILEEKDEFWDYSKNINYDKVNIVLDQERRKSFDYLKKVL